MERLIYLYGFIRSSELTHSSLPSLEGFDRKSELYPIQGNTITAIVCGLDSNVYTEETLQQKVDQDVEWLKRKALHHHETLLSINEFFNPVIPLSFCTVYKSENSLINKMIENEQMISETLNTLDGTEEWNLKIYCDQDKVRDVLKQSSKELEAKRKEIQALPPGRQYFEKKKLDKWVESQLESKNNQICERIHEKLKAFSIQQEVKSTWSKEVTGSKDKMAWNSVFLLPEHRIKDYLKEIEREERAHGNNGWRFEVSGPWPAYHFSSIS
ncbi:GvpL/GvpF family gas vesicle protein [Pseudalkalibacillus sp. SCS-8]|uniref:GvpL/GvpF family gas vesicle protein n=1 Tax=Pseudalkalibacillus nanhaiensis TaxID=3115291 RepID=UPI0032DAC771